MAPLDFVLDKPLVIPASPAAADQKPMTIEKLSLDFDALTGADVLECSQAATVAGAGGQAYVTVLDEAFRARIGAKAAKLPFEVIRKLPAREFLALTSLVQRFFFEGLDSPTPT